MKRMDLADRNKERSRLFREKVANRTEKMCPICKEIRSLNEYHKQSKTYDGRQSRCIQCANKINRLLARDRIVSLRSLVYEKLGHVCNHCGFSDKRALQVDHKYGREPDEKYTHRGVKFYLRVLRDTSSKYQILCANCNWIKRHVNNELPKRIEDGISINS